MTETVRKYLGHALYTAKWVGRSNLVRLTATGLLPCSNYLAQFEKRAERVVPPMWDFVFFAQDTCQKGLKAFEESVVMICPTDATMILVHDASGINEVAVEAAHAKTEADQESFCVFARFPKPEQGHQGCVITPGDSLLSAWSYRAFGPAPRAACDDFVRTQGRSDDSVKLRGGEVPWPLLA